jgi:hypothetical protein
VLDVDHALGRGAGGSGRTADDSASAAAGDR